MSGAFRSRGPKPLSEVLSALMGARGYGRLKGRRDLETAWETAVGEQINARTRVGGLRHGVLTIVVSHPALLEELSAFHKPRILEAIQQAVPEAGIKTLKFRVGPLS